MGCGGSRVEVARAPAAPPEQMHMSPEVLEICWRILAGVILAGAARLAFKRARRSATPAAAVEVGFLICSALVGLIALEGWVVGEPEKGLVRSVLLHNSGSAGCTGRYLTKGRSTWYTGLRPRSNDLCAYASVDQPVSGLMQVRDRSSHSTLASFTSDRAGTFFCRSC